MAGGILLQSAATAAGNGNVWNFRGYAGAFNFTVETSNDTVSAGAVTLEQAPRADWGGTWEAITTAITPVQNDVVAYQHVGSLHAVRARISTAVTGGATVTVRVSAPLVVT